MKKKIVSLIAFILLFTNSTIFAKEKINPTIAIEYSYHLDTNKRYSDSSFRQISDFNDSNIYTENKADGVKVYYKEEKTSQLGIIRYGEWFKSIQGKQVNFKQSIEEGRRVDDQFQIQKIRSAEFLVDNNKCQSGAEFINNNCQSSNLKQINTIHFKSNIEINRVTYDYFNIKNTKENMYSKVAISFLIDKKMKKISELSVVRDSANRIKSTKEFDYLKNVCFESVDINSKGDLYEMKNVTTFGLKQIYFNNRNKVYKQVISYDFEKNDEPVDTHVTNKVYHSNGKYKYIKIQKKSSRNKLTFKRSYKYNSKGIKRGYIRYNYKNGQIIERKEYVLNSKGTNRGSAYRYVTLYKKGKRIKTYRQTYNKKGKLLKKKSTKHRKDFY